MRLICHPLLQRTIVLRQKLRASLASALLAVTTSFAADGLNLPVVPGPYQGSMDSLTNYQCPEWFRDAKFGIWAHWGPQAVPMAGDWYAKHTYVQGHAQYKNHLENYGHPSTNGYKDIIPLWKAEKWDPDRLMALYKKAGAKYFVSMGSHHDNFYLWNSKLHKWNSVNMGPKRDVVGDWQKAAKKLGLRFGVSEHLGASFTWFQPSHGSDKTGPMAGVPYDGANPQYQDLYHFPAEPDDKGWYSKNPRWQQMWFDRIKELVEDYQPDLLYTDGGVPFANAVGLSLIADFYNDNLKKTGGKLDAVYNCKQKSDGRWVEDLERGVMPGINPHPWQTDTSIGDWYYNKNWKFRPVSWTIHMLVDIVSKNGNLLLNVVQRPDGSLDPEAEQALEELATWIAIHGEGIYGTRPWVTYGEGRIRAKGGHFKEDFGYSAADIRFTSKGDTLYAFALGWPDDGKLLIRSLAKTPASGQITGVSLLGNDDKIQWTQTDEGLAVTLPAKKTSQYALALKIDGQGMRDFTPAVPAAVIVTPDAKGNLVLSPDDAETSGGAKAEAQGGQANIGFWDNGNDFVSWKVRFPKAGAYELTTACAAAAGASELTVEIAGEKSSAKVSQTKGWNDFQPVSFGKIAIAKPGDYTVKVGAANPAKWKAVNLRAVKFTLAP